MGKMDTIYLFRDLLPLQVQFNVFLLLSFPNRVLQNWEMMTQLYSVAGRWLMIAVSKDINPLTWPYQYPRLGKFLGPAQIVSKKPFRDMPLGLDPDKYKTKFSFPLPGNSPLRKHSLSLQISFRPLF